MSFESSLQRTTTDHCEGSKWLSHWLLHCDSSVLEEPLPRDFPTGTHVRQLSQNEPTSNIENGFGHRTVKEPTSEESFSNSGGGVACLLETESDSAHGARERVRGDGVARTTLQMPVFIGQRKLWVKSYEGFFRHDVIILGEKFLAFIADFGSIVLDRPVDQTFPQILKETPL